MNGLTLKKDILKSYINGLDEPFIDDLIGEYFEGKDTFESKVNHPPLKRRA